MAAGAAAASGVGATAVTILGEVVEVVVSAVVSAVVSPRVLSGISLPRQRLRVFCKKMSNNRSNHINLLFL